MDRCVPHANAWSAIVLAAGQGQRLGGVAKPLIELNGEALLLRLVRSLFQVGAVEVVCVAAAHAHALQARLDGALSEHAHALSWVSVAAGLAPSHSLHAGLCALQHSDQAVMVCLADQPFVQVPELQALCQAYATRPATTEMVVPWVQDKPGNPVFITPALAAQWHHAPGAAVGKAWREQHPALVYRWQTSKVNYLVDIDTAHDVESLRLAGFSVNLP